MQLTLLKEKRKPKVYVDASCESWRTTEKRNPRWCKGTIVIVAPKKTIQETFIIEENLRQFINRFELKAIERAHELYPNALILSDSQIAVGWAKKKLINVEWIPREQNKAGFLLDEQMIYGSNPYKEEDSFIEWAKSL